MNLAQLASQPNLALAWRRITTGTNLQYKNFFRHLYLSYEAGLESNLRDLRDRLRSGAFIATPPERIYIPKASGLHRPISLLALEDQIVLQAFANLAAKQQFPRRAPLQYQNVFSNILSKPDSIFFFRRWQETYRAFQKRVRRNFDSGLVWVGDFDLAAFYETVSHELLIRTLHPRAQNECLTFIADCLRAWSSERLTSGHGHGLPQGPLASDFLAECFLLPIDLALQNVRGYVRYVDDVRLFGESEDEVRRDLIVLERHCRERGLIPQVGKFAIKRAHNVDEALGMLPSLAEPRGEGVRAAQKMRIDSGSLRSAVDGRPQRVVDKTRLRFLLFRAEPDSKVMTLVLRLVERHPEHVDVFFLYLRRFPPRVPIERMCLAVVNGNPYQYVRGEAWHLLAVYLRTKGLRCSNISELLDRAMEIVKATDGERFAERLAACHFLCAAEEVGLGEYSRWLLYQNALVQALAAGFLPPATPFASGLIEAYLKRSSPEPGLAVCHLLQEEGRSLTDLGIDEGDLAPQVAHALRELGLVATPASKVDAVAEILARRFRLDSAEKSWRLLLGSEYDHALGVLRYAETAFSSGRSVWLQNQNAFNQVVFLALQDHFAATGHSGTVATRRSTGTLHDYGITLDPSNAFSSNCPGIADAFRSTNQRRNRIPSSHPYEKRTGARAEPLRKKEQDALVVALSQAFQDLVGLMP